MDDSTQIGFPVPDPDDCLTDDVLIEPAAHDEVKAILETVVRWARGSEANEHWSDFRMVAAEIHAQEGTPAACRVRMYFTPCGE